MTKLARLSHTAMGSSPCSARAVTQTSVGVALGVAVVLAENRADMAGQW